MNPKRIYFGLAVTLAIGLAAFLPCRAVLAADEELSIEEETAPPAAASPVPATAAVPAAKKAVTKAAPRQGSVILRINVVPGADRVEVRVEGRGKLVPTILTLADENKLVLDFKGASYKAPAILLGAPGIGDVTKVRGGQFQAGVARVVIELKKMVKYTSASKAGVFTLSLGTQGVIGPEDEASAQVPATPAATVPVTVPEVKTPAAGVAVQETAPSTTVEPGVRSRLLHAMVSDLDDRVRLVATSDGVVKYKIASQDGGKSLSLTLYDMDLKWTPARIDLKDGPILSVRAEEVLKPAQHVRLDIKLRQALPYHVKRDQNQVVIEVERAGDASSGSSTAPTKGDLMHRVTLNVQGEDLASLIKGLAFEAGFENVVVSQKSVTGVQPVTISLRDVPLAKALNLILSPEALIWKVERNVLKVAKTEVFDAELSAMAVSGGGGDSDAGDDEGGLATRVFRLRYINVMDLKGATQPPFNAPVSGEIANIVTNLLVDKKNGRVVIDTRSNCLVITDASSNMKKLEKVIRELDISVPQIMIEARLVSITAKKVNVLGVDWDAEAASPSNPSIDAHASRAEATNFNLHTGMLLPGFNLDATLRAMITNNDAKVMMNPRISTLQDRKAILTTKTTRPYPSTSWIPQANGTLLPQDVVSFQELPITLEVRPHVNPNKTVSMEISIVSTVQSGEAIGGVLPTSVQSAVTQLVVRDGETAVIGGMMNDTTIKTENKVPLLGDLPWFLGGGLFRQERMTLDKQELVLFLKPQIVPEF